MLRDARVSQVTVGHWLGISQAVVSRRLEGEVEFGIAVKYGVDVDEAVSVVWEEAMRLLDLVPGRSGKSFATWLDERADTFRRQV